MVGQQNVATAALSDSMMRSGESEPGWAECSANDSLYQN